MPSSCNKTRARIRRVWGFLGPVVLLVFLYGGHGQAQDRDPLVQLLIKKGVITEGEVRQMEEELKIAEAKKKAPMPAMLEKAGTALKIKGRWAAGYFQSGREGSDPNGGFRAPEAKVQLAFTPDPINTIIMRMNLNNATFNNLDYFYLESKDFLPGLEGQPFSYATRLGRFKMDFGEETWSNNPVESALPSNSVANVGGNDEGAQLAVQWKHPWSPRVTLGLFNGNAGTGTDNVNPKAMTAKLALTPVDPLYLSMSYFNSFKLKGDASEMSIAGITARPGWAREWERQAWELNLRYDIEKGKAKLDPPAYTDSLAYLRGAYGQFYDDASSPGPDRNGDYAFIEGLWNIHPKWYAASRWSIIDFDRDVTGTISGVTTVGRQNRYAIGAGYRWSKNTIIKGEWLWDVESQRVDADDAANDQLSLIVASQF